MKSLKQVDLMQWVSPKVLMLLKKVPSQLFLMLILMLRLRSRSEVTWQLTTKNKTQGSRLSGPTLSCPTSISSSMMPRFHGTVLNNLESNILMKTMGKQIQLWGPAGPLNDVKQETTMVLHKIDCLHSLGKWHPRLAKISTLGATCSNVNRLF